MAKTQVETRATVFLLKHRTFGYVKNVGVGYTRNLRHAELWASRSAAEKGKAGPREQVFEAEIVIKGEVR